MQVVRRRVLQCRRDRVVGIEDDLLDGEGADRELVVIGEGALLAALTRARDHTMRDIVATIQAEQDEIIRAALAELGSGLHDIVRVRVYLVDAADFPEVAAVHGELFGEIRPTNTTVVVAALLDPRWRVEIETEAVSSGR